MSITTKIMQVKRTCLMQLNCLPELVSNKVAIVNSDNTYTLHKIASWIKIENNYNPLDYSLVVDDKWGCFIDRSKEKDREVYHVNKQLKKPYPFRISDKIHVNSRKGIYEVINISDDLIEITCKKWQYDDKKSIVTPARDFKCLAGGLHNYAE